jgi:hypothetical protein
MVEGRCCKDLILLFVDHPVEIELMTPAGRRSTDIMCQGGKALCQAWYDEADRLCGKQTAVCLADAP